MARCGAILLIALWAPWATAAGLHASANAETPPPPSHCTGMPGHAPEAPPLAGGEADGACLLHCTTAAQAAPATVATCAAPPVLALAATPVVTARRSAPGHAGAGRSAPIPPDLIASVVLRL